MSEKRPNSSPSSLSVVQEGSRPLKRQRQFSHAPSPIDDQTVLPEIEKLWANRDFDALETLIARRGEAFDINVNIDVDGVPLLCLACREGPLSLIATLLRVKAQVSECDIRGRTALHFACEKGRLDVITAILAEDGDHCLNEEDDMECTPLRVAFENGHRQVCEVLLSRGADVNTKDIGGYTVLHIASMSGRRWWGRHLALIELVTSRGIDIGATDNMDRSPLHYACFYGNLEVISWLLDHGADVNAEDQDGHTPLWKACQTFGRWWQDQTSAIEMLLHRNARINHANNKGRTVLHLACEEGHLDLAEALLARGADIHLASVDKDTPLHLACEHGRAAVVEFLLSKKAVIDPEIDNDTVVRTPLHSACQGGQPDVVKLLLARGARVDVKNSDGQTPIHIACSKGYADVVEVIARAHIKSIEELGSEGTTLVGLSCNKGHVGVVRTLLTHDKSWVNREDDDGNFPLYLTLHSDNTTNVKRELAVVLFSFGATPMCCDYVPDGCDSDLGFIATNFPMITLHQMLRSTYDPVRARLRKPTLTARGVGQWGLHKVFKMMFRHDISWNLWWMILKKTFTLPE